MMLSSVRWFYDRRPSHRRKFRSYLLLLSVWLLLPVSVVQAHLSGYTDTSIQIAEPGIRIVFTTPIDNLLELEPETIAGDDGLTPVRYFAAIESGFEIEANGQRCTASRGDSRFLESLNSAQFQLDYQCREQPDRLLIRYRLFLDTDESHRNMVRLFLAGKRLAFTFHHGFTEKTLPVATLLEQWGRNLDPWFGGKDPNKKLDVAESSRIPAEQGGRTINVLPGKAASTDTSFPLFPSLDPEFFRLGVVHILQGYDHVLFVAALLLIPAALSRLAGLITSFTVAHSITLGLSVFDIVTLPPTVTEPLIALSILYVAWTAFLVLSPARCGTDWVMTLRARKSHRWMATFAFGLVHGFGFSYILKEMGLGADRASALLMFNLGVEAGQLLIILLLFPLLHFFVLRQPWGRSALRVMALAVGLLAAFWFLQRVSV